MNEHVKTHENVIAIPFGADVIKFVSQFVFERFAKGSRDLGRVACVFGGRRPALFLSRSLAKRFGASFIPPKVFAVDEFVEYVVQDTLVRRLRDLEAAHLIYQLVQKHAPSVLKGRRGFGEFLPWAREIASFIEQLDLEDIDDCKLVGIQKSAHIGYEIPENINRLLSQIVKVRAAYRRALDEGGLASRGHLYLKAARAIGDCAFEEFDAIIFCNFFYLHATESSMIKTLLKKGKGMCIFEGAQDEWSVLGKSAHALNVLIRAKEPPKDPGVVSLYQGADIHSQVSIVGHLLTTDITDHDKTVIVLPRAEAVIPLLSEVSGILSECNVSMGYPLRRTALYSLCVSLAAVQESKKDGQYYSRDYLSLLRHPLIKNLSLAGDAAATRVLVHKLEDFLQGKQESNLGGRLFCGLAEIEREEALLTATVETVRHMGVVMTKSDCAALLQRLHTLFFRSFETIDSFVGLAAALGQVIDVVSDRAPIEKFPFNLKVIDRIQSLLDELATVSFNQEVFPAHDLWDIFTQRLESGVISFVGSPLGGTQILGLLETRSLHFDNVIVLDVNESVLPRLTIHEPLIPREVMLTLGLNRLEKEEEIQRYQFMRLVAGAQRVCLVYEKNHEHERSRFIEELLWDRQKKSANLSVEEIPRAQFPVTLTSHHRTVGKTDEIVAYLKEQTYSASRVNTYLSCPLQFYYQYVLGLQERDDLLDDPQAPHIGTFIHELLEDTFKRFEGKRPLIDASFRTYFSSVMDKQFEEKIGRRMKSDSFLLKAIIQNRMERFLNSEVERNVAKIILLEEHRTAQLTINGHTIPFRYTADRIDEFDDGTIVIIDYKTGGSNVSPKKLAALNEMVLTRQSIQETIRSFQLPLYYFFIAESFPGRRVNAQVYNVRSLDRKPFITPEDEGSKEQLVARCHQALEAIFAEMFDISVPFEANRDDRRCQYCAFNTLCR